MGKTIEQQAQELIADGWIEYKKSFSGDDFSRSFYRVVGKTVEIRWLSFAIHTAPEWPFPSNIPFTLGVDNEWATISYNGDVDSVIGHYETA